MADDGWAPDIASGESWYSFWGWLPNSYSRPDVNGEGGGQIEGIGSSISFDGIRARVDNATSRWLSPALPDGSAASPSLTSARSTAATLGASGTGGSFDADGVVERNSGTVKDTLQINLSGAFTTPFYEKYYAQFLDVVHGIGVASAMLEMNYSVQSQIWSSAGTDAATLCDNARQALTAYADETAAQMLKYSLTVVSTIAGAVASIATAGAAAPLVASMVVIGGTATMALQATEAAAALEGSSYDELMTSLEGTLETLATKIKDRESALNTMMNEALETINASPAEFDLDKYSLVEGDYPGTAEMIDIKQYRADLVSGAMKDIGESLAGAKASLESISASNPSPRHSTIGAGSTGTHTAACALKELTLGCLASTAQEYERGRELFNATVAHFFENDATTKSELDKVAASESLSDLMGQS